MSNTSVSLQSPIDKSWVSLLRVLDTVFKAAEVPYLLGGGNAREILLAHVHGCTLGRTTTDLDFGVLISDWSRFDALKDSLEATGCFRRAQHLSHRMFYMTPEVRIQIDLVPFGAVAGSDGILRWPPDGANVMSVLGYEQAMKCALRLELENELVVPIVSLEELMVLKFVAWADNGINRLGKDAVDILTVITQFESVLGLDMLYDSHPELMEHYGFNSQQAAAHVLGLRVASLLTEPLRQLIQQQLSANPRQKLVANMLRGQTRYDWDAIGDLLTAFERGLGEP